MNISVGNKDICRAVRIIAAWEFVVIEHLMWIIDWFITADDSVQLFRDFQWQVLRFHYVVIYLEILIWYAMGGTLPLRTRPAFVWCEDGNKTDVVPTACIWSRTTYRDQAVACAEEVCWKLRVRERGSDLIITLFFVVVVSIIHQEA